MVPRFKLEFEGEIEIEISEAVLNIPDEEWRSHFYPLYSRGDVVGHLAYNAFFNHARLTQLDGFADRDDSEMELLDTDYGLWCVEELD